MIRQIFAGADGGKRDAVLLNAAGAIAAGGLAKDLGDGVGLAREAIDSGAAGDRLEALIAFSKTSEVAA
jgi:anthranilate phosphoribosyltransferase